VFIIAMEGEDFCLLEITLKGEVREVIGLQSGWLQMPFEHGGRVFIKVKSNGVVGLIDVDAPEFPVIPLQYSRIYTDEQGEHIILEDATGLHYLNLSFLEALSHADKQHRVEQIFQERLPLKAYIPVIARLSDRAWNLVFDHADKNQRLALLGDLDNPLCEAYLSAHPDARIRDLESAFALIRVFGTNIPESDRAGFISRLQTLLTDPHSNIPQLLDDLHHELETEEVEIAQLFFANPRCCADSAGGRTFASS